MTEQPEKMNLRSLDVVNRKQQELLRLFPEVRTEHGKVDFDRLKLALGEQVDMGRERYGINWPGKADCFKTIQAPSTGTLLPCPAESVNFETTQNLIIDGDNLEVLKLLQKSYLGKIKMIYIDPPYNTGNDFIYPDDYTESLKTYLEYTGQVDAEGRAFSTNTDRDGRFHSKWLNMMYPRLYLARDLLRQDGVIFISIGDHELAKLTLMCDELFGEENFLGCVARVAKKTSNKGTYFAPSKDYVLVYARRAECVLPFMDAVDEAYTARFKDKDDRGHFATVGLYQAALDPRPNQRYWIQCPDGSFAIPPGDVFPEEVADAVWVEPASHRDRVWRWTYETYLQKKHLIVFKETSRSPLLTPDGSQSKWNVYTKYYLEDRLVDGIRPRDYLDDVTNDLGTAALKDLGLDDSFDYAKPPQLLRRLIQWLDDDSGIYMDFFAGSGTMAQAVLEENLATRGNRQFILVQLPEPCPSDSVAAQDGYDLVTDICKERVRRVIKKLNDEEDQAEPSLFDGNKPEQDRGFRVFKLATSNFKPWNTDRSTDAEELVHQLELHIDHIDEGRTQEDILYEILLKSGFPLTASVEKRQLAGKMVYGVEGELLICLENELTLELIRAMAGEKPQRVVCLDEGFAGNDQLKVNAVQILKTEGITSFKTV